jgi:hypothetical protein
MGDVTAASRPYAEVFGCLLDDGEDHGHEGDCRWHWFCGLCSRPVDGRPCPVHAPTEIPGLELAACPADPPHPRTFFYAQVGGYGAPCMYCSYDAARAAHEGCRHSHHRPWRRWKATGRLLQAGYALGVVKSWVVSIDSHCRGCADHIKPGKNNWVLGRRREWWFCLLRRRHLMRPVPGIGWLCGRCSPDPLPDTSETDLW